MKCLLLIILLLPQLALARVYMCVDPATGASTFTDVACDNHRPAEELRIDPANSGSGRNMAAPPARKIWSSERDERQSGREFSAQQSQPGYASRGSSAITDGK